MYTPEEKAIECERLSRQLGVSARFAELLLSRGLSPADVPAFLRPSFDDMQSPFAIDGMENAVKRIREAIDKNQRILVFGDYDCDGISATAILMLALRGKTDVAYYIPDRFADGYGMTVGALEKAIAARRPDLVITVDCGITSADAVEYLKARGIDVIVTDHHEPQDSLPDCIIVDPKAAKKGFYDYCGAGVAYMLAQALFGREESQKLIDIAAVATIADVVPLVGDNRVIAFQGLKRLAEIPRPGIKLLAGGEITSQEVMFRIAPRINAAGRLGSAMKAPELFLETDHFLLKTLAEGLERDNSRRQEICEAVVADAKRRLRGIDFCKSRIIILRSGAWEAGVLGIAAARLAEEFCCPAILFSEEDGICRGSARSVPAINVFELLSRHKEIYLAYGGHAQAAGVTVAAESFDELAERLNADVLKNYDDEAFIPKTACDMTLNADEDLLPLARELKLLEPTGYGNPRPVFAMEGTGFKFERLGISNHIKCVRNSLELMGFGRFSHCLGATGGRISVEFTLSESCFRNRVYPQGVVKAISPLTVEASDEECALMCVHQLSCEGEAPLRSAQAEEVASMLSSGRFGTLLVCFSSSEYRALTEAVPAAGELPVSIAMAPNLNPLNRVVVAPAADFDFGFFRRIIICGRPFSGGFVKRIADSCECVLAFGDTAPVKVSVSDEAVRKVYIALRELASRGRIQSLSAAYDYINKKAPINRTECAVCVAIIRELGLISANDRGIISVSNKKTDLKTSPTYRNTR